MEPPPAIKASTSPSSLPAPVSDGTSASSPIHGHDSSPVGDPLDTSQGQRDPLNTIHDYQASPSFSSYEHVDENSSPSSHSNKGNQATTGLGRNDAVMTLTSPIGQHIVNVALQLAAIVAAVTFGYFAVRSVQLASRAYEEARLANQIAIYAICDSDRATVSIQSSFESEL